MQRMWRRRKPRQLEPVDKWIYGILSVLAAVFWFGLFWAHTKVQDKIAFSDPTVIARYNFTSVLLFLPLWLCICGVLMYNLMWAISIRRSILGKQPPNPLPEKPKILPRKISIAVKITVLLLVGILCAFSFYGRECLHDDGSVTVYNTVNRQTVHYSTGEVDTILFGAHQPVRSYSFKGYAYVQLQMKDGRSYYFEAGRSGWNEEDWISALLDLKARFDPEQIILRDPDWVEWVVQRYDYEYTDEEMELLYRLFEIR